MALSYKVSVRKINDKVYQNDNYFLSLNQSVKATRNAIQVTATRIGTTASINYTNHGYKLGDIVEIIGVAPFSGTHTITSATQDTFNLTVANSGAVSDTPIMYNYVVTVNEFLGGNATPVQYTVLDNLLSIQSKIPSGASIYITQVNTSPYNNTLSVLPSEGYPTLLFMNKNVNFREKNSERIALTDIDRTLTSVTATSSAAHGLQVGEYITVSGASDSELNGIYQITSIPTTTTLTYTTTLSGSISNATGFAAHTQTVFNQYEEGARNVEYVANEPISNIEAQVQNYATQTIYDNVTVSGTTAATTTSYLSFGVNVITTASVSNYAIRLPYPPVKGRSLTVVNTSGYPIVVYPSVDGGSINGAVNGSASVPSDGKSYVFTCWENPLPGAWSWTPPATNQYNSGDLEMATPSGTGYVTAVTTNIIDLESDNNSSTGVPLDGKNKALIINQSGSGYYFKPSSYWNEMTKIKVYTNTNAPATYYLKYAYQINYYNPTTGAFVGNGSSGSGDASTSNINSAVSGTFVPSTGQTYISDFIGDAGTLYAQVAITPLFGINSTVGDRYLGQTTYLGNTVDVWYTGYIKFVFKPNASVGNIAGVKFQFFIEYN